MGSVLSNVLLALRRIGNDRALTSCGRRSTKDIEQASIVERTRINSVAAIVYHSTGLQNRAQIIGGVVERGISSTWVVVGNIGGGILLSIRCVVISEQALPLSYTP